MDVFGSARPNETPPGVVQGAKDISEPLVIISEQQQSQGVKHGAYPQRTRKGGPREFSPSFNPWKDSGTY